MDIVQAINTRDWLRTEILAEFGYSETWKYRELEDRTNAYWLVTEQKIVVCESGEFSREVIKVGSSIDSSLIIDDARYLSKDGKYVLLTVDTNTDRNEFLYVLDVAKECKDKELIDLYRECW